MILNAENITQKVLEKEGTKKPYASRVVKVAATSVADTQTGTVSPVVPQKDRWRETQRLARLKKTAVGFQARTQ